MGGKSSKHPKGWVKDAELRKRRQLARNPLRISLPINAKEFKTIVEE